MTHTAIEPFEKLETLEAFVLAVAEEAAQQIWPGEILFNGRQGERRFWITCSIKLNNILKTKGAGAIVSVPEIAFDLGIKINQTRIHIDRGEKYTFVLAVEDCVRGMTNAATRMLSEKHTELIRLEKEEADQCGILQNGSMMKVSLNLLFPFEEVASLRKGEFADNVVGF